MGCVATIHLLQSPLGHFLLTRERHTGRECNSASSAVQHRTLPGQGSAYLLQHHHHIGAVAHTTPHYTEHRNIKMLLLHAYFCFKVHYYISILYVNSLILSIIYTLYTPKVIIWLNRYIFAKMGNPGVRLVAVQRR